MQIEYVNPKDLKPYELNSKNHPESQIKALAKEISEVGFHSPIVISHDNVIVAGHGRQLAALELGLETVPVYRLPADISPERIRAIRLFDNKIAETENDKKLLKAEIESLISIDGFDFSWTGYGKDEVISLLPEEHPFVQSEEERKAREDEKADDVPELTEQNPRGVMRGQVWKLGRHRLMCGDSTSADDVSKLMGEVTADMTFTSPPYNAGGIAKLRGNTSVKDNLYGERYDDNQNEDDYLSLILKSTALSLNHSRYAFWNIQFLAGNRTALPRYWAAFSDKICDVAIWDKGYAQPAAAERVLNSRFEFIFIFTSDKNPNRAIRIAPAFRGTVDNVFELPPRQKNEFAAVHAATFPVMFPETFVDKFCPIGGSVLELFGGTGTTMIACEKTGRTCFMMELDEHYVSVIIERWEQFTGQKATLLTSP